MVGTAATCHQRETIKWQFNEEGEPYLSDNTTPTHSVHLFSSETGLPVTITEKPPTHSHKTLGIMENPNGNYEDEYTNLRNKSARWRDSIINQHLTRPEIKLFYQSFYLPSISYHLTINTFTEIQLEKIQHPIIQVILQRLGYNENMPKDVIYGPTTTGGLGFHHLFSLQGLQKIKQILQAYRNNTPLRNILHTTFQWDQHVAGTSKSIFQDTGSSIPQLQNEKWILTLRHFLHQSNLQLHLPQLKLVKCQRNQDRVIMDLVTNTSQFTAQDIQFINRCRVYLRITTIADITNAQGTHITRNSYNCSTEARHKSPHHWPYQPGLEEISSYFV